MSARPLLRLPVAGIWCAAGLLSACEAAQPTDPWADVEFAVEPSAPSLALGVSQQFGVVVVRGVVPPGESFEVSWRSTDLSVAQVTPDGFATATGPGQADIIGRIMGAGSPIELVARVSVPTLRFDRVEAGDTYTCGVTTGSLGYCWGDNISGQLGVGTMGDGRLVPALVAGGHSWRSISPRYRHTCGLTIEGDALCWGWDVAGRLGDGIVGGNRLMPSPVSTSLRFEALAIGAWFSCGLTESQQAYCWGFNGRGSLGDGTSTDRGIPTPVQGGHQFASISAGALHACALDLVGRAYCWGSNDDGELGDGTREDRSVPTAVATELRFSSISTHVSITCAVTQGGSGYCWGDNIHEGRLGNGEFGGQELLPVWVASQVPFETIVNGLSNTCGLTTTGSAYCWGSNVGGKLGRPPMELEGSPVPVPVMGGHVFDWIGATGGHTCGRTGSGLAFCWGTNPFGELGTGQATVGSYLPLPIFGQQ